MNLKNLKEKLNKVKNNDPEYLDELKQKKEFYSKQIPTFSRPKGFVPKPYAPRNMEYKDPNKITGYTSSGLYTKDIKPVYGNRIDYKINSMDKNPNYDGGSILDRFRGATDVKALPSATSNEQISSLPNAKNQIIREVGSTLLK